ncbi:MAG: tetratricopeptide repeat protein [Trueperaceae bacterium]
MSEQRFVVEVARPVPAAEVDAVAALVADWLRMDAGRIRTLLDGRTGPVTRPIRADKADAIARVFADAGVEVYVVAHVEAVADDGTAASEGPGDRTGLEADPATSAAGGRSAASLPWEPESWAAPDDAAYGAEGPWAPEADDEPWRPPIDPAEHLPGGVAASDVPAADDPATDMPAAHAPADDAASAHAQADDAASATWPPDDELSELETWADGPPTGRPQPDDLEEEADRLGPGGSRSAVDAAFLASTRWVPSPHESEAVSGEGDPDGVGRGPAAAGASARESTASGGGASRTVGRTQDDDRWWIPRSAALEKRYEVEEAPRARPALRVYLLLALVVSLLVLIVLQVVNAGETASTGPAAFDVGMRAYRDGDFVAARKTWEPLSERGDARAAYYLGHMAEQGLGQAWSNARAARYYRQAADAGLPDAQMALAELHMRGMGVDQDAAAAVSLYRAAANAGHAPAQYALGLAYVHGTGVPRDFEAAMTAFVAAAQGGVQAASDIVAFAGAATRPAATTGTP